MWHIIREAMQDIERRNDIMFEDTAWDRLKQLERDLETWMNDTEGVIQHEIWEAMPEPQKEFLKTALSGAVMDKQDTDARFYLGELGEHDYIKFDFADIERVTYRITLRGRYLLKANGV